MNNRLWNGLSRGLLVGLLLGLLVGAGEAYAIIAGAPVRRAALIEAGAYAVVVDMLVAGGLSAALSALITAGVGRRVSSGRLAALQVAIAVGVCSGLAGLIAEYPPRVSSRVPLVPHSALLALPFLAAGVAVLTFVVLRSSGDRLFRSTRVVSIVALALFGAVSVTLVPQLYQEAQPQQTKPGTGSLDMSVLDDSLATNLDGALASGHHNASESGPLNVVLIALEDTNAAHIGACGASVQTPAIDSLARAGTLSCNTYAQQPQTNPAFASLFTSTYPSTNGVRVHMVDRLSDSFDTIAKVLSRNGYTTSAVLPWTSDDPAFSGLNQGFQVYEAYVLNEPLTLQNPLIEAVGALYRRMTDQVALPGLVERRLGVRGQTEEEIVGRADITTAATFQWLDRNNRSPFFLWVHFFDPHYPWTPPPEYLSLYDRGPPDHYDGGWQFVWDIGAGLFNPSARDVEYLRHAYAAQVSYADHYIGEVLGSLAQRGLLHNTIIIFTTDTGEELGEHGTTPNGDYWLVGDDLYTPGIQVPLVVYDPRLAGGERLTVPIQHIDVMPTLLELLGLPSPAQVQGRSIVPLMLGRSDGSDRAAFITLADDRESAIVRADGWKLIAHRRDGTYELYNLNTDPGEQTDLATVYPDRVADLASQLQAWERTNGGS